MIVVLLSLACAPSSKDPDGDRLPADTAASDEGDADTDADTDADADADTDADADADTGLPFDLDTSEARCAGGLDWLTQLYTAEGFHCTSACPAEETLLRVAVVVNACDTALTFDTLTMELVAYQNLVNVDTGIVLSDSIGTGTGGSTLWTLAPGQMAVDTATIDPLSAGNYQLILGFNDPGYHSGFLAFVAE